ncbi:MAG: transcriptional repressor [Treponema sp.]|nr:transcriptional repressor [Treponema sp.]
MENRYSAQRDLILKIMDGNKNHPTADEIYDLARQADPHISRGTVYRNLNLLVEKGQVLRISVPNNADHYDSTLRQHYHFHCIRCNCVYDIPDFDLSEIINVERKLSGAGYKSICHSIVFEGTCPNCSGSEL